MRLIDADELIEHAWRDKLDSRELIAQMIATAPTIKEIPTKIPIYIFERLLELVESQEPKIGHWIKTPKAVMGEGYMWYCDKCEHQVYQDSSRPYPSEKYCPNCGAKMIEPQESEGKQ